MGKNHLKKVDCYEWWEEQLNNEREIHNLNCLGILNCPYCNRIERDRLRNMGCIPP